MMIFSSLSAGFAEAEPPRKTAEVEGITEYQLDNGLRLLLYPDQSKPTVTVSLTVFVGSRHEGAGEGGMAHLLEHMLFKGTPDHEHIPKLLQDRGASFNGTTNNDRTNYYETLPEGNENLEFAIRLEADRMVNSRIRGEDLESEMTVVRNEFERAENSPFRVLNQKMMAAAYQWHNYGRATIGNRADIERVPLPKLRAFYRKYYQPDNVMVVVAGSFDKQSALSLVNKYFGAIPKPQRKLPKTYTEEPPQDGERQVFLRRVGEIPFASAVYHIPAGAHSDFASLSVLAEILGSAPSGRLYRALVETKLATQVGGRSSGQHDPGVAMFYCVVPKLDDLESARATMLEVIEGVAQQPITSAEVNRARQQILKDRELQMANTSGVAISLSGWASQGDWRLFFLFRDRVEAVTPESAQQAAVAYLRRNNRTVGTFVPTEKSDRVAIPSTPDIEQLVSGYEGRGPVSEGERLDPEPAAIERRIEYWQIPNGPRVALLPKKTRQNAVQLQITLRYGNEDNLRDHRATSRILPELMMRGTRGLSRQELEDALTEQKSVLRASGQLGDASFSLRTQAQYLPAALELVRQVLREPALPPKEFELIQENIIAGLEQSRSSPEALAGIRLERVLSPFDSDNVRYTPTIEERIAQYRAVKADEVQKLYDDFLGSAHGQIAIVGQFDPKEIKPILEDIFSGWKSQASYGRIETDANTKVKGNRYVVQTPGKDNAVYAAGISLALSNKASDYPALLIGNWVLGSSGLSSRLGDRIRQKEGLSYSVRSSLSASAFDERGRLGLMAISNPANTDRVVRAMREELKRIVTEGITETELEEGRQAYLQRQLVNRTRDSALVQFLSLNLYAERTMQYYADLESRIGKLTREEVHAALKKYVDLERLVVVTAGDFSKVKASSE